MVKYFLIQTPQNEKDLLKVCQDNFRKLNNIVPDIYKTIGKVDSETYDPGKVKISITDDTSDYLQEKLAAGANITLTKGSGGSDEILTVAAVAGEPALGNPGVNGYVLSSTTAGVRSWVVQSGGSSFTTNSKASMSADQTITDKTWTKVNFDTDVIDTDNELDNTNFTWVCTTTGTYIVSGVISWIANDQGLRAIGISEDGSAPGVTSYISTVQNAGALATTRTFIFGTISCTAAQAISIWGYHSKGSSLDIDSDGSYFAVFRIA